MSEHDKVDRRTDRFHDAGSVGGPHYGAKHDRRRDSAVDLAEPAIGRQVHP